MSKYTTEVRYVCEHYAGLEESDDYAGIDEVIRKSRSKIFDFDYPLFDPDYRVTLETKILMHYYTREIGFETVALWKHFLKMRMNEIMPYYNKLYESELLMPENPFNDTDYTREGERHGQSENTETFDGSDRMTGTVTDDGDSTMRGTVSDVSTMSSEDGGSDTVNRQNEPRKDTWTLYSDTPQGGVAGISAAEASVGSNAYLTNATHVIESGVGSNEDQTTEYGKTTDSEGSTTRTYNTNGTNDNTKTYNTLNKQDNEKNGSGTNDEDYFERIRGKMGKQSYASLVKELRNIFLNIDVLIIRDLGDLFMNVY